MKLEDVSKRYGDAIALYPTNLSVESGETTVLIGPSGCGKSTLLRIIIRLIEPDSGSIEFDGKPVTPDNINALRRRIGYVIQEGGLFPHLTARANVLLMARHIGQSQEETHNRLLELSELTRFSEKLLPRYPVELSGGQRQRVSLMRALMLSPELLLLDEPLGALDPLVRASLQKDLKEIFTRLGQTVLFVTHDLAEAIYFADAIVLASHADGVILVTRSGVSNRKALLRVRDLLLRSGANIMGVVRNAVKDPEFHYSYPADYTYKTGRPNDGGPGDEQQCFPGRP